MSMTWEEITGREWEDQDALKAALVDLVNDTEADDDDRKPAAVCLHEWPCDPMDVELKTWDCYGLAVYEANGREYAIGDDDEADKACELYCLDSAWAFKPEFLAGITGLPKEAFAALGEKCENGNDGTVKMIEVTCGVPHFVSEAISADGRGHLLSGYDGNEVEIPGDLYLYRTN